MLRAFEEDYGVEVIHALGHDRDEPHRHARQIAAGTPTRKITKTQIKAKLKQGRSPFTVEMKIVDDEGVEKPHDGKAFGRLMVRGPSVARAYFKQRRRQEREGRVPGNVRLLRYRRCRHHRSRSASCRSPTAPRT